MTELGENVELLRRQHLEAVVIRACECGAPGTYHSDLGVKASWPGVWVEETDLRNHMPVGEICPNCGATRPANEHKGTVWYREWWGRIFTRGSR